MCAPDHSITRGAKAVVSSLSSLETFIVIVYIIGPKGN